MEFDVPKKRQFTPEQLAKMARKANYTGGRPKDESKLSTDPRRVRMRLRRALAVSPKKQAQIKRDIEILYQKPLDQWDNEELARGRPRNADGGFQGRPPSWITPTLVKEAKRRLLNETFGKMAGHVDLAIQTVVKLITSEEVDEKGKPIVDARTKLAASTFILEHVIGKPENRLEITSDDATRQVLASAIVLDDGRPQGHLEVWEGEVVEDDDPELNSGDDDGGE